MSKRIELKVKKTSFEDVLRELTNLKKADSMGDMVTLYLGNIELKVESIPFEDVLRELKDPGKAYSEGVLVTP